MKNEMRKPVLLLVILSMILCGTVIAQDEEVDIETMMQQLQRIMPAMQTVPTGNYVNENLGYEIEIPEGWNGMLVETALIAVKGDIQAIMNPSSAAYTFTLAVGSIEDDEEARKYATDDLEQIRAQIENADENVETKVVEVTHDKLAGIKCVKAVVEGKVESLSTRTITFFLTKGNLQYSLIYLCQEKDWDTEFETFIEDHRKSFKLK